MYNVQSHQKLGHSLFFSSVNHSFGTHHEATGECLEADNIPTGIEKVDIWITSSYNMCYKGFGHWMCVKSLTGDGTQRRDEE